MNPHQNTPLQEWKNGLAIGLIIGLIAGAAFSWNFLPHVVTQYIERLVPCEKGMKCIIEPVQETNTAPQTDWQRCRTLKIKQDNRTGTNMTCISDNGAAWWCYNTEKWKCNFTQKNNYTGGNFACIKGYDCPKR